MWCMTVALSTIVTMPHIKSSGLIHLITESLHPFTSPHPSQSLDSVSVSSTSCRFLIPLHFTTIYVLGFLYIYYYIYKVEILCNGWLLHFIFPALFSLLSWLWWELLAITKHTTDCGGGEQESRLERPRWTMYKLKLWEKKLWVSRKTDAWCKAKWC